MNRLSVSAYQWRQAIHKIIFCDTLRYTKVFFAIHCDTQKKFLRYIAIHKKVFCDTLRYTKFRQFEVESTFYGVFVTFIASWEDNLTHQIPPEQRIFAYFWPFHEGEKPKFSPAAPDPPLNTFFICPFLKPPLPGTARKNLAGFFGGLVRMSIQNAAEKLLATQKAYSRVRVF